MLPVGATTFREQSDSSQQLALYNTEQLLRQLSLSSEMAQDSTNLRDLFSSLRARTDPSHFSTPSPTQQTSYDTSNVSVETPQSMSGRDTTPVSNDNSANLLHLLKFSGLSNRSQQSTPPAFSLSNVLGTQHGRGTSASDLVGSFMGNPSPHSSNAEVTVLGEQPDPQDFLLQLLRKKAVLPTSASPSLKPELGESSAQQRTPKQEGDSEVPSPVPQTSRTESPIRVFGEESREVTPFQPQDLPTTVTKKKTFTYVNPSEVSRKATPVESQEAPPPVKMRTFTYVNPFDQLAASSPRHLKSSSGNENRAPKSPGDLGLQKDLKPASAPQKLTPDGSEILQSIEGSETPTLNEQPKEKKSISIGAPTDDLETVAEALNQVGEKVNREVEHALAARTEVVTSADQVKEVQDSVNQATSQETMPKAKVQSLESDVDNGDRPSQDLVIRAGETKVAKTATAIPVFNFPVRPFVAIIISGTSPSVSTTFRKEALSEVARVKKEFDQSDRNLVTASHEFIGYALPKSGVRIIRQDDAVDRKYFDDTRDRIFNTALSFAPPGKFYHSLQAFIATGVSGTVYWVAISNDGEDNIQKDHESTRGIAFPPFPAQDEHTPGGQSKTRAKKSSRHPEFFAVGRGKSIQIVFPLHAQKSAFINSSGTVDTEKYFEERRLKINTGKAGKDFAFSEDDSVIATLDKAGRLRLWDIRELIVDEHATASKIAAMEVGSPLVSFPTAGPGDKSWPTSVMFVDKARAYLRGIALRYIIVGLKQNHILQLWDLALGKAVQELRFPHEKETDGACTICYHAPTGVIVVGHPTRNSIYFVHLSAPRYNLPAMTQAKYAQLILNKDPKVPKPDNTAIMSGVREYLFSPDKKLRSLDLLPAKTADTESETTDDPRIFELFVMHSKGVTCIEVKKSDLGWNHENRVINPVDSEAAGYITVQDLRELNVGMTSDLSSTNGDALNPPSGTAKATSNPTPDRTNLPSSNEVKSKKDALNANVVMPGSLLSANGGPNGTSEQSAKKKKSRNRSPSASVVNDIPPQAPAPPSLNPLVSQHDVISPSVPIILPATDINQPLARASATDTGMTSKDTKSRRSTTSTDAISLAVSSDFLDKELQKFEATVATQFSGVIKHELDNLYRRFDDDKRVQAAAANAKQDAVLRLVSSSLTENVESLLSRTILDNIQTYVIPAVNHTMSATMAGHIRDFLLQNLTTTLPQLVQMSLAEHLPQVLQVSMTESISRAITAPHFLQALQDQVSHKLGVTMEGQISSILLQNVMPKLQRTESRVADQLHQAELKHQEDSTKIDQLTVLVKSLSEMVHTMASAQSKFQGEILKLQHQATQQVSPQKGLPQPKQKDDSHVSQELSVGTPQTNKYPSMKPTDQSLTAQTQGAPTETVVSKSIPPAVQQEIVDIAQLMNSGLFEQGTIKVGLQSPNVLSCLTQRSGFNRSTKMNASTICSFTGIPTT